LSSGRGARSCEVVPLGEMSRTANSPRRVPELRSSVTCTCSSTPTAPHSSPTGRLRRTSPPAGRLASPRHVASHTCNPSIINASYNQRQLLFFVISVLQHGCLYYNEKSMGIKRLPSTSILIFLQHTVQ
jgi:hypothetical protein